MKTSTHLAGVIAGLTLGVTPALAEDITTKERFLERVAGKKLTQEDDSWVVISPNGTVNGQLPGQGTLVGDWTWNDGYYCRDIAIDDVALPHDCQAVSVDGDVVTFAHDKGGGISVAWTMQ